MFVSRPNVLISNLIVTKKCSRVNFYNLNIFVKDVNINIKLYIMNYKSYEMQCSESRRLVYVLNKCNIVTKFKTSLFLKKNKPNLFVQQ